MFKKILAPIDGSETAWKALEQAKVLAENFDGELLVMYVVEPYSGNIVPLTPHWDSATLYQVNSALEEAGEKVLEMAKKKLSRYSNHVEYILEVGHPSERIVSKVKSSGCDAVVIGSRGLGGVTDFLLGSVSSSVVQYSPVPVLIVR